MSAPVLALSLLCISVVGPAALGALATAPAERSEDTALRADDACLAGGAGPGESKCSVHLLQGFIRRSSVQAQQQSAQSPSAELSMQPNMLALELSDGRLSYLAGGPFSAEEVGAAAANMANNLFPNGTVIASPSTGRNASDEPDYYYMWQRDSGITMRSLLKVAISGPGGAKEAFTDPSNSEVLKQLVAYAKLNAKMYDQNDPNDCPPASGPCNIVGDAKFFVDGSVYNKPWGRPQNDGPALAALALIETANAVMDAGLDKEWLDKNGILDTIHIALQHVSEYWLEASVEPWEMEFGRHFFVSAVQQRALAAGSALADRLSSADDVKAWNRLTLQMTEVVTGFWDDGSKVVRTTVGRPWPEPSKCFGQGLSPDNNDGPCLLDIAVQLGSLYAKASGPGSSQYPSVYGPADSHMLATTAVLVESMAPTYEVNKADDKAGIPGVLIGRYPGDEFQGYEQQPEGTNMGKLWGNPWFLSTHSLADILYQSGEAAANGELKEDALNSDFLHKAMKWAQEDTVPKDPVKLCSALVKAGDAVLARAKHHMLPGMHISEQIQGQPGHPFPVGAAVSAKDLTWSYGSLLDALVSRYESVKAWKKVGGEGSL